jgi:hypothetical protein
MSENHTVHSDSFWGKKSEKTTNISDMPAMDSNLESPGPFSITQSIDDSQRYEQIQSNRRKYSSIGKNQKISMKRAKKFKFEDYDLIDGTEEPSDFQSNTESFDYSSRNLGRPRIQKSKRYGEYDDRQRNDYSKNKYHKKRNYENDQQRALSLRKNKFNHSKRY